MCVCVCVCVFVRGEEACTYRLIKKVGEVISKINAEDAGDRGSDTFTLPL